MHDYRSIESDDYYDMACGWMRTKNRQKAEDCLLRAIDLNPYFIHAYLDLSGLYARQERYTDAVHILKKASRYDPSFDKLHYHMARYAYKNEDYANARKFIERARAIYSQERYEVFCHVIEDKYRSSRH